MSAPLAMATVAAVCPYGIIRTYGLGKNKKDGSRYIYFDYEPQPGIQWAQSIQPLEYATYRTINAWVRQEYGLNVSSQQIAQVRRENGIVTARGTSRPRTEGLKPVEVPPEKEAAIEAAFRHFGMIPEN